MQFKDRFSSNSDARQLPVDRENIVFSFVNKSLYESHGRERRRNKTIEIHEEEEEGKLIRSSDIFLTA